MKTLFALLLLLFSFSSTIQAQNWWDWSVPTGAIYSDDFDASPVSVSVDGQNNYLVLNSEEIIKYNRNGTLIWKKKTISDARGICTDANGNIYANAQFGLNGGKITKLDADSNIIWSVLKQKYNTYRNVVMSGIYVAPDGDVYVSGYFNPYGGVATNDSLFWGNTALPLGPTNSYHQYVIIAKISRQGVPQWIRMLHCAKNAAPQSRRSHFYSIVKDSSNNIYMTGDLADGTLYLDHDTITSLSGGAYTGFVMQVNDNNGSVKWAKSIPPVLYFISPNAWTLHEPCFAALHGNNGILVAGSNGYLTRPAGQNIWNSSGYLISYDSLGNQVWQKRLTQGILGFIKKNDQYYSLNTDSLSIIDSGGNYLKQAWTPGMTGIAVSPVDETIAGTRSGYLCKYIEKKNKVSGYVFRDVNNNGIKDSGEKNIAGVLIGETPNRFISVSNSDGYYECYVDSGSHTIAPLSGVRYNSYEPSVGYNTNFPGSGSTISDNNFAFTATPGIHDLEISTTPVSAARPGFTSLYSVYVKNTGTENATGTAGIKLPIYSSFVADTNFTVPLNTSADSLTFAFTDLPAGEEKYFNFKCQLSPSVRIGDLLTFYAAVIPSDIDTAPSDNYDTLIQTVRGSYDPNDKMVFPGNNLNIADKNKPLSYTIRFQNTGTDTALNVHLVDTLSSELDIATLELVSSSHAYSVKIEKGNVLHFYFDDINLPDSFHNEVLSHGYIRFNIKPLTSVTAGSTILNNATIYFDYNKAVITNTTSTKYLSGTLAVVLKSFSAFNTNGNIDLHFATETEMNLLHFEIEKSKDGRLFKKISSLFAKGYGDNYKYTDKEPNENITYYRIKLIFADGSFTYSAILAVQMNAKGSTTLFPNPAAKNLSFRATAPGLNNYKIYSADGRLNFAGSNNAAQTGTVININTSTLTVGNYYLEISNMNGREIKLFVIK